MTAISKARRLTPSERTSTSDDERITTVTSHTLDNNSGECDSLAGGAASGFSV